MREKENTEKEQIEEVEENKPIPKEPIPYQLKLLVVSSITMFVFLCSGSAKLAGIGLLWWVITVFWAIFSNFKRSNFDLFQAVEEKGNQITTKKGIFAYSFVIAMVVIGLLTIGMSVFVLLFVM